MKSKTAPKSPEQRARELLNLVHPHAHKRYLDYCVPDTLEGWLRLARYVLALEKKVKKR